MVRRHRLKRARLVRSVRRSFGIAYVVMINLHVIYTWRSLRAVLQNDLVQQGKVSQGMFMEKVSSGLRSVAGETLCDGVAHQFGSGVDVQSVHEACFMEVDGLHGDVEQCGNFLGSFAFADQL